MNFIVIDGAEIEIHLDGDESGESVSTAADCPTCGPDQTDWDVERRGFQNEDGFIVCACGAEYPIQWRKDAAVQS